MHVSSSAHTQVYPSGVNGLSRHSDVSLQLALAHGLDTVERDKKQCVYMRVSDKVFIMDLYVYTHTSVCVCV